MGRSIALALEGIRGKTDSSPALGSMKAFPIDRYAVGPELAQRVQYGLRIRPAVVRTESVVRQRGLLPFRFAVSETVLSVFPAPTSRKIGFFPAGLFPSITL